MTQPSSSETETTLSRSAALLDQTQGLLVITGAGISAESGIPTYRGPGSTCGLIPDRELLARDPDRLWQHFDDLRALVAEAKPNTAHRILAQWEEERRFPRFLLATQNIDGLHQEAGSSLVSELHGSLWQMACLRTMDYTEDEQFSNDFSAMMSSGGGNESILKRWSEENNRTIWTNRDVPFAAIPPYADPQIRPNVLLFDEDYGNRLLWVEDFIRNGVDTVLVIGCSGGVAVLDRLLRQCRQTNPDVALININAHQDCIGFTHHYIPMKACAAMESLQACLA